MSAIRQAARGRLCPAVQQLAWLGADQGDVAIQADFPAATAFCKMRSLYRKNRFTVSAKASGNWNMKAWPESG